MAFFDFSTMMAAAFYVMLPEVVRGRRDDLYSLIYCLFFFTRSVITLWLFGRYAFTENKLAEREWDGDTRGLGRNQLLCYLYDATYTRLGQFYRLRLVWDVIIYMTPVIILFALEQVTFSLFMFVISIVLINHLFCSLFMLHSWSMKCHFRIRAMERSIDKHMCQPLRPILEKVIVATDTETGVTSEDAVRPEYKT